MNAVSPSALLGRGLYPLREAARIAQLPQQTARRWAVGNVRSYAGERRRDPGLVALELPELDGKRDVTFAELLTLRLVKAFRTAGLSLTSIRKVAALAAHHYGGLSPMVTKSFHTDGRTIFVALQEATPANDEHTGTPRERRLINVLTGQAQFAQVVDQSLFANVDWRDDQAGPWWPEGRQAGVVLDPAVLFGAPRLGGTSLPTAAVAQAVAAEGGGEAAIEAVADWHGITPDQVRQAVTFETQWLAKAA